MNISKRLPRAARRTRKPFGRKINYQKKPRKLKCTYVKCLYEWEYRGNRNWADCPKCHTCIKVAVAIRNYVRAY